jgi:hypothetical protein
VQFRRADDLRVAAVEALGEAENRRQGADRAATAA